MLTYKEKGEKKLYCERKCLTLITVFIVASEEKAFLLFIFCNKNFEVKIISFGLLIYYKIKVSENGNPWSNEMNVNEFFLAYDPRA